MNAYQTVSLIALSSFCLSINSAYAAEPEVINMNIKTSKHREMDIDIIRIAIGSPDVATVVQLPSSEREFLIVAKNAGSTSLFVWTADGQRFEYLINVSPEDVGEAMLIEQAIGLPNVHVRKVGTRVLLTGTVKNQYERNYAVQTARLFVGKGSNSSLSVGSGIDMKIETRNSDIDSNSSNEVGGTRVESAGEVIDLLHMVQPTQIRLEAQVIAIRPQDRENIGIQYGNDPSSAPGVFFTGESYGSSGRSFRNNPLRWASDRHADINLSIQALVTQNRAKILSRPSITTMSGE
ncbi:MAG: pilus assembly protein N-terminal domain-containing protein, partial [Selenomonadaceae bacterium]|nr:pilus assembly protein N-terminal domain-containing protein [Selenomonadaceae bacterium]